MMRWLRIGLLVGGLGWALLASGALAQEDTLQAELEAFLAEIASEDGPAVAAAISIGEETWTAARGLVDVAGDTPVMPDDRFRIGSISKTFLAVALLQLQEQGVLTLEDPLTQWLPAELTSRIANGDAVTLYDLVTMTSGIPDYLDEAFFGAVAEDPSRGWTAADALTFAYDDPPLFDPGTGFEYSNTNYLLLQLVIEAATNAPLDQVFRRQILEPLALADTYTQVTEDLPGGFVQGYEDFDGDGVEEDVTAINDGAGLGDGGLISNTGDLTRFFRALLAEDELIDADSRALLLAATSDEAEYGAGIELRSSDAYGAVIGHTGGVLGFNSAAFYAPDLDALVVILYAYNGLDEAHIERLLAIAAAEAGDE